VTVRSKVLIPLTSSEGAVAYPGLQPLTWSGAARHLTVAEQKQRRLTFGASTRRNQFQIALHVDKNNPREAYRKFDAELLDLHVEGQKNMELILGRAKHLLQGAGTFPSLQEFKVPLAKMAVDTTQHFIPFDKWLTVIELCGGTLSVMASMMEVGFKIRKLVYVEPNPKARAVAGLTLARLQAEFPKQLAEGALDAWDEELGFNLEQAKEKLPSYLEKFGAPDLVACGWPCTGMSAAGGMEGLENPGTKLVDHVAYIIRACQQYDKDHGRDHTVFYFLENVPEDGRSSL